MSENSRFVWSSAIVKNGNAEMEKLLRNKGIYVLDLDFYCYGAFTLMHRGHPDADDLNRAAEFSLSALRKAEEIVSTERSNGNLK